MLERIRELCQKRQTNFSRLEKSLNFANGSIAKTKEDTISAKRVKALSDYFHVSMEYLMTGEETPDRLLLSQNEQDVIDAYRRADEGIKISVCKLLDVKKEEVQIKDA